MMLHKVQHPSVQAYLLHRLLSSKTQWENYICACLPHGVVWLVVYCVCNRMEQQSAGFHGSVCSGVYLGRHERKTIDTALPCSYINVHHDRDNKLHDEQLHKTTKNKRYIWSVWLLFGAKSVVATSPANRGTDSFLGAVSRRWQSSRANLWVNINFHHHRLRLKAVLECGRNGEKSRTSKSCTHRTYWGREGKRLIRCVAV